MSEGNPPAGEGTSAPPKVKKVVRYVERERPASSGDRPATTNKAKSEGLGAAATALVALAAIAAGLGAAYCVLKFTPFGQRLTGSSPPEKEQ